MAPEQHDKEARGTKRRRIARACDYCHHRSIRCRPSTGRSACQNCVDFAQACTYERKARRRGPLPQRPVQLPSRQVRRREKVGEEDDDGLGECSQCWKAPYTASQAVVMDLVELYFEIVYPIFPLFHQPSFTRRISRAEYTSERTLYATTMAVCALVSGRIRDGSVTNPKWDLRPLRNVRPETFYNVAKEQLGVDVQESSNDGASTFETLRTYAVLALVSIQNGKVQDMHRHLGTYHIIMAVEGWHDEHNWPASMGVIEREERRRLFWSMYTLDVYAAVVWGSVVRSREQQSDVAYPTEADDDFITDAGITCPSPVLGSTASVASLSPDFGRLAARVPTDSWLSGWNFITDLYRILEHALARYRGHRSRTRRQSSLRDIFEDQSTTTEQSVSEKAQQAYLGLPACFRETPPMSYSIRKDRLAFQAANATASLQLVRMVLFVSGGASIQARCQIASEVVNAFVSIPSEYLLAISTPLLHHLGGIGAILGSVLEEPLGEGDYRQVRAIMLSMAQLLENLEAIHQSSSASQRLRAQIARIDEYMARQRQEYVTAMPDDTGQEQSQHIHLDGKPWTPTAGEAADQGQHVPGGDPGQTMFASDWSFQVPPEMLDDLTWSFESWNYNLTR